MLALLSPVPALGEAHWLGKECSSWGQPALRVIGFTDAWGKSEFGVFFKCGLCLCVCVCV